MLKLMPQALDIQHLVTVRDENQLRQYTDAAAAFRHHQTALKEAREVRGSMVWRTVKGREYLVRTSTTGSQSSLGPRTAETTRMYERFMARKEEAKQVLKARQAQLETMRKLNRAYQVGRTPNLVVDVLSALQDAGISEQFMTIGTHAMYAYESACGVMVDASALATRDMDLLYDTRRHIAFMTTMNRMDSAFIDVLRRADRSFKVMDDQKQTAVNDQGFEVDVVRRTAIGDDPHPLSMSDKEGDLWAVQVSTGNRLISSKPFNQLVVASTGRMAMMQTVDPRTFVDVKTRLAAMPSRDAVKRPKDLLQARVVAYLIDEYMPDFARAHPPPPA